MRIFKSKAFNKWAAKESVSDQALTSAVADIENGLIDADLGGYLYKKRVAVGGKGKSGGVRTLLAFKLGDKAFFIYGFAKNARANIKQNEETALKRYAAVLLGYSDIELNQAVTAGVLIEVKGNG
ncbi:type II toxin-antitoxin system RelE/ParE family toxin [Amphritea sp.]|uniref:type II toxin-antitoxin system RelE/ParE family toxin n=1 Tax=Amphritea sp. TaxID=1872502 RepID=UPI0025BC33B0|nr:type II toxin-antitoxin system RelE/ParE family toxin [Amphritea sp.]